MVRIVVKVRGDIKEVIKQKAVKPLERAAKDITRTTYKLLTTDVKTTMGGYGSPMWTGTFAANHMVSLNYPDTSVRVLRPDDWEKAHGEMISKIPNAINATREAFANFKLGDKLVITNASNTWSGFRYAPKIEYEGLAETAPRGVYRVTASFVTQYYKDSSRKRTALGVA